MTRRDGIIAVLSAGVGIMSGHAKAEGQTVAESSGAGRVITQPKGSLTFNLENYTQFTFTVGDDSVTLTPAEIMAALKQ